MKREVNAGTLVVGMRDAKEERESKSHYAGVKVVGYFRNKVRRSPFGKSLVEGIVRESEHRFETSPAYLARVKMPFFQGIGMGWDLRGFSYDGFIDTTDDGIMTNWELPDTIPKKIRAILAGKPIEFTFKIRVNETECITIEHLRGVLRPIDESTFFGTNAPTA